MNPMPGDKDYAARKGEALWDHANRVAVIALAGSTVRLGSDEPGAAKEAGHYFGAYQQSFTKTRSALADLLGARVGMHRVIHWEPTGDGRPALAAGPLPGSAPQMIPSPLQIARLSPILASATVLSEKQISSPLSRRGEPQAFGAVWRVKRTRNRQWD